MNIEELRGRIERIIEEDGERWETAPVYLRAGFVHRLLDVVDASEERAYCESPNYRENWTPVDCGTCSGCILRKRLAELEETK
ncbi:MAG TPA: hypothetical protein VE954_43320 [Oligoflexus sp.]|uniref:hypothetical protein n=1 Tax=Oligoflexus sp. TaxID=1971216 RepID=UPI002D6B26B2|nr:hypothetical protein [Oligoflexus sp.]HYX39976.1 hypothetical protein [Oligoflexus sp.]